MTTYLYRNGRPFALCSYFDFSSPYSPSPPKLCGFKALTRSLLSRTALGGSGRVPLDAVAASRPTAAHPLPPPSTPPPHPHPSPAPPFLRRLSYLLSTPPFTALFVEGRPRSRLRRRPPYRFTHGTGRQRSGPSRRCGCFTTSRGTPAPPSPSSSSSFSPFR